MSLSVHIKKRAGDFLLQADFEQEAGVTGILGASGCGKSMTLKCIAGIMKPDEGRIVLNGRVLFDSEKKINLKPQERHVGYLFQNYALFPNMTVEQNILCGLSKEKNKQVRHEKLEKMLRMMDLGSQRKQFPQQLSGGQQQRTALARILVSEPELLLLDEPFSALDSFLREQLQTQVQQILQKFGKDAIMVSHNRDEVYYLCSHVAIMDHGQIINMGPTKAVFANPGSEIAAILTAGKKGPSMDAWLKEAKAHESAAKIGMYLTHNGVVRQSAKAKVREHAENTKEVKALLFSYDAEKVNAAVQATYEMEGIYYIKTWLNEGRLAVGDDIMYVLIGGDIRPRVIEALNYLVGRIKNECVEEIEIYD